MQKKHIAYILIGAGALVAIYYLYKKNKDAKTANSLGAGMLDQRGTWAAEDDALYVQMRNKFKEHNEHALGWIDPGVEARYTGADGVTAPRLRLIKGAPTKAGAFLSILEEVNPNPEGTYVNSAGQKVLFPQSLMDELWYMYNSFKVKHGGL
jgi:hypothetical protein